jgi:HEAT repeat protein
MRSQILVILILVLTGLILYLEWPSQPADKAKGIRATGVGGRLDKETGRAAHILPKRSVPVEPTPAPTKEVEPRTSKAQVDRAKEELKTVFQSTGETVTDEAKKKIKDLARLLSNAGESGIAALGEVVMSENKQSAAVALQELSAVMQLPRRQLEKARGTALLLKVASNHENTAVRVAAVALLGEMKIEEALQLLTEIARTAGSSELKGEAAVAIGEIGSPKAVQALLDIARNLGEGEQIYVIRGLAHSRGQEAVGFLLETLSGGSDSLRTEAALALGKMRERSAVTQLKDSFSKETSDTVAVACAKALATVLGSSETAAWLREQISGARSESEKLRALIGLSGMGGQTGRDALFAVAKDDQETESVRIAAMRQLDLPEFRENMKESVIQFLKQVAEEERSEPVRAAASAMLDQWGATKEPKQPEEQPQPPAPGPQPPEEE